MVKKSHLSSIQVALGMGVMFLLGRLSVRTANDGRYSIPAQDEIERHKPQTVGDSSPTISSKSQGAPLRLTVDDRQEVGAVKLEVPKESADLIAAVNAAEAQVYEPIYEGLGISGEDSRKLIARLGDIHIRANIAQSKVLELSEERKQYNDAVKELLTPEKYQEYLRFEQKRPIQKQFEEINSFAESSRVSIAEYETLVSEAIGGNDGVVSQSTHGPYDPAPSPSATGIDLLPRMTSDIQRLSLASENISRTLIGKVPDAIVLQIENYYNAQIGQIRFITNRITSRANMSPSERMQTALEEIRRSTSGP